MAELLDTTPLGRLVTRSSIGVRRGTAMPSQSKPRLLESRHANSTDTGHAEKKEVRPSRHGLKLIARSGFP